MKQPSLNRLFYGISAAVLLSACQKDLSSEKEHQPSPTSKVSTDLQSQRYNTFYGHQVPLGNGKVRTFFTVSHTGVPTEIGIEMTEGALQGLPGEMIQLSFPFHQKATDATPFVHVLLDWNPHGHEPFFYELPHFDFHFYLIGEAERLAIAASSPLMEELPPTAYWPQGFVPTPGGVPQMGKHWVNPAAPEIGGGQTFTHTMIYGSYAGELIFVEPMITRAFLLSGQPISIPYGQPAQFMVTGTYYPTTYNVYRENGKYHISLTNFVWRS